MKKPGENTENFDDNWNVESDERIIIKNNKDPPIEDMGQINCEFPRSVQNNEEEYVRRPMNAFMVWSRSERRKLALKYPNMLNCEISKLLGAEWSKMSEIDKKPYILESKKLRTIHNQKYPEYSYRPRRKKRKSDSNNSLCNSTSMNQNGISCYGLQSGDIYDPTYGTGSYNNFGYFYDQFSNPSYHLQSLDNTNSTCHNLNYSQTKYNNTTDNKLQNYYPSYQSNCTYPSTYSDAYKLVAPYSNDTLQSTFQCANYFSNFPYMNNSISTSETFDKNSSSYNFGTINNLFPDITTNSTANEIANVEQVPNQNTTTSNKYPTTTTPDATKIQST